MEMLLKFVDEENLLEETYTRTVNPDLSIQPKTNAVLGMC